MKYSNLSKQNHRNPATFTLAHLSTKFDKQCFNITSLDIGARWAGENSLQGFLVLPFHS